MSSYLRNKHSEKNSDETNIPKLVWFRDHRQQHLAIEQQDIYPTIDKDKETPLKI